MPLIDRLQPIADWTMACWPQKKPEPQAWDQVQVIAHRGAWSHTGHLENTLESFRACLNTRVWAIEFDIRWTQDQVPVVHHDSNTRRVFGKSIEINQVSFSELRRLIPQILSFQEVIEQFGKKIHLMIELKTKMTSSQKGIFEALLSRLKPQVDYHVMSLQTEVLIDLEDLQPQAKVAIARTNVTEILQVSLEQNFKAFTGHYLLVGLKSVKECQKNNLIVGTGFINSKNLLYREVARGVKWIYSNRAIEIAQLINDSENY